MARRRRNGAVAPLTKEAHEGYNFLLTHGTSGSNEPFTVVGVTAMLKRFFKDRALAYRVYRELAAHRLVQPGERVGKAKEFTVVHSKVKVSDETPTRRRRRRRGRTVATRVPKAVRARQARRAMRPAEGITFDELISDYNRQREELRRQFIERFKKLGVFAEGVDGDLILRLPK